MFEPTARHRPTQLSDGVDEHRPYTDKRGYPSGELLIVKVDQAGPVPDPY